MVTDVHDLKVVGIVVQSVIVLVMYVLLGGQLATKCSLHYNAVLPSPPSVLAFDFPIPFSKFGRICFCTRTGRKPSVVVSPGAAYNQPCSGFWVTPFSKASTPLGAVGSLFVYPNELYWERFLARFAAAEQDSAFFAGESLHVSILYRKGDFVYSVLSD